MVEPPENDPTIPVRFWEAVRQIREAGFDGPVEVMVDAAEELLDPESVHQGRIDSIAAHFGLWN